MKITEIAIHNKTTVIVLLFIIVIIGVYSYLKLPRESSPEVVIPYIFVTVRYEGVSPEDIESLITIPIERKLTGLSGVKEIQSQSTEGFSSISIEFQPEIDVEDALQRVKDKVDQAKSDLPADADEPSVFDVNFSEFPILIMCLTGDYPLAVLNELAEDVEDKLESIPGVLDVRIIGGVEREIQIEVDPDRLAMYGIPFTEVFNIVTQENVNTPAGSSDWGEGKYMIRTPGEFKTPEEIENLIIRTGDNGSVYLKDVAIVRDGFKDITTLSRINDKPSITLTLSKRAGVNIIQLVTAVKQNIEQICKRFPSGVDIKITWDESIWIHDMVTELENSILSGSVLVLFIIFISLGFRNAVMVSLAIPLSMLITFIFLYFTNISLNMVCLFSLILAVGMLVDNGIVVVENIYRHIQEGMPPQKAAVKGTHEVSLPIIGSTLTTIAAFIPLFFWPGIWGKFMIYLPITVCVSLFASLFVGLVINPTLAAVFLHQKFEKRTSHQHIFVKSYEKLLQLALRHRLVTICLAVVALITIVAIFVKIGKTEFLPEIEPPQANIDIKCPEGTNLAASDQIVREIENIIRPHRDNIENIITNVGFQSGRGDELSGSGGANAHLSRITLDFPRLSEAKILPSKVLESIRSELKSIVGAEIRVHKMGMGPPSGPPINIEISGEDYEILASYAEKIKRLIETVPNLTDLRDDYSRGKPEMKIVVDRVQALKMGLNTFLVGEIIKTAINGRKVGEFREGDNEYDVTVRFPPFFKQNYTKLRDMVLINAFGSPVPFSAVARLEQSAGLGSIKRINRKRTITVSAEVVGERRPPEVLQEVKQILSSSLRLPPGYTLSYTGENEENEETQAFLTKAFIVAIILVAFVLIAQFNSIVQALIIMSTVILSLVGVFLGYLICHMPFGILMSGIGCISLAGVVVNNGIVLLQFINELREEGYPLHEAIVRAGTIRLRPVMLTAITTIVGLIPMAVGINFNFRTFTWNIGGESSQWWGPMAVAVIFGLSFATLLTLVVVPTMYSVTAGISDLFRHYALQKNSSESVPI